jgi:hypothetical protein
MAIGTIRSNGAGGAAGAIAALVGTDGTASHPHFAALRSPVARMRDLRDAIHIACMLHGRHPGVFDFALAHTPSGPAREWLTASAEGFAIERQWLATLVAAAGPLPSTPGQAESEAAVAAQRHALDTLVQSDRTGCAAGAAAALLLDWAAVRALLDQTGDRLGLSAPVDALPDPVETSAAVDAMAVPPGIERAALFGAHQLLAQQRGMWDLLEARASARGAS